MTRAVIIALLLSALLAGCAPPADSHPAALYVRAGYLCPPDLPALVAIEDREARMAAVAKAAIPIADRWLIEGRLVRVTRPGP